MYETSGALSAAIEAYLAGGAMTDAQIAAMRAYLQQWIAGEWAEADMLRANISGLVSREAIATWLADAEDIGIDPL